MPSTVSGSNSWSFAIIGDLSLEAWQRSLRMTGEADAAKSSKLFFPSFFFFFACFLIFLKKEFPERKIALEIFPKKDEGALQITVQSMTNATFETVGQVRKAIFACLTTDLKKCLYLYFLALLYFLHALLMAKTAYHCLKKMPRGDFPISKTYPEPRFFFWSTMLSPQACFLSVCELVSIRLSDSKWADSPPAKVKPVKD